MSSEFNPNSAASPDSGIFGLNFPESKSQLVILPVPWEVTTSYGGGTSLGPAAILKASRQVDLFDLEIQKPYEAGIFLKEGFELVNAQNETLKALAQRVIRGQSETPKEDIQKINAGGKWLNEWVYTETRKILGRNQVCAVLGGDHSVPLGAFQAIGECHSDFGILHFDAHSDTRKAYEGFTWSHASIFFNALELVPQITQLTQVGIRDFCEEELLFLESHGDRVKVFFDNDLKNRTYRGEAWDNTVQEIVETLPQKVWVSFDIDGLSPAFCPHTGTPVPGGLDFNEAVYLIAAVVRSGRTILGFDLCEVAPDPRGDEWDANVGARLLYKLSAWTLVSRGFVKLRAIGKLKSNRDP